ncbi:TlpA family protein disulfide reductase [Paraflavitalea pollutisoli]|uniref:TlpA family protein disulfide reductase n=1 Tax=Paraflavitalea pollutisoli TaxID=3034143 RepID=UPI0023EBEBDD|nr:TlpA disulfide reductase family protein [Paraflavitalea sp. H1-2-19X]
MRLIILVLLTICLLGCGESVHQEKGDESNSFRGDLMGFDGKKVDLKDYAGKAVFINLWATWCTPCRQEMPAIASARDSLAGKNIVFLFASDDSQEEITAFEQEHQFKFNYVFIRNREMLSIPALPTSYVFDARGRLVHGVPGAFQWNDPEHLQLLRDAINAQ